ncbi:MAG: PQQ-dependent sugar dehydrogenase [Bacteroidota bacterium]|nr:PQQ-dependent sugar dehydrogenase [Bacteroidota bacterium]MDP4250550.1 PQQ-dependent sugar dehydrogenase [Bacteroidota bacterium]
MRKNITVTFISALILFYFNSCNSETRADHEKSPADSAIIASGLTAFNHYCAGCHNFRQDGIGPRLGGITTQVSAEWFLRFIKSPQQLISSGDPRARQLFIRYKQVMPSFSYLKEEETNAIFTFLKTRTKDVQPKGTDHGKEIPNPFPAPISFSGLVVNLRQFALIPPSSDYGKHPIARITKLDFEPGTGELFVVDLRGKLYKLHAADKPTLYLNMAGRRPKFIHEPGLATGFGSFAFHPEFLKNGLFYTTHTEAPGSGKADFSYADSIKVTLQWVLTEWKADHPGANVFSGTSRELLRINMVSGIHGVQEITFNPLAKPGDEDYGLLYIGVGDGGSVENGYPFLAHSPEKVWGTILRIDPGGRNSANGKYGIPPDNPFVARYTQSSLGEIYAYGFRNPHRISWSASGEMLACNIGQTNIESVDLILPGHDYGWPVREGNFVLDPGGDLNKIYPLPANDSVNGITYPVAAFDHDEGHAISGGLEYLGKAIPQLKGKYLFGDIPSGRLFYINMADVKQGSLAPIKEWKITLNGVPGSFRDWFGDDRVDLHFGRDSHGELYLLTKSNGAVYKVVGLSAGHVK